MTGFVDEWLVERPRRLETESGLVVCEDDMLFARAISLHSADKAFLARTYAEIVGTAMRKKRWPLWWVELFAGPGRLYVRDTDAFVRRLAARGIVDSQSVPGLRVR
jgi:hypothetical protein